MIQNPILLQKSGVDTSDATATAENIDYGYTAYVNGEKIEGTSTKNADTSMDTVDSGALLEGYTAHDSMGNGITGTCTYNADTRLDNVHSGALLEGYTAHDSNGDQVYGACPYNSDTSGDNVSPEVLLEGYTAHDSSGNPISGNMIPLSLMNASVNENYSNVRDLMIEPSYMDDRLLSITLNFLDNYGDGYTIAISVTI